MNQPNEYGKTALHYAASSGTPETVYALIGDPIINVNARNYLGWTPLHCAVCQYNERKRPFNSSR